MVHGLVFRNTGRRFCTATNPERSGFSYPHRCVERLRRNFLGGKIFRERSAKNEHFYREGQEGSNQQGSREKISQKQDWQGLDRMNRDYPGQRAHPIPASPVSPTSRVSIAPATEQNFTDQVSGSQPSSCRPIGIIAAWLTLHRATPVSQTDPVFCSVCFRDFAGCRRSRPDP